ncbi:hypothetical protein [Maribacter polysiphoniae]|uniref:hypothetical protein n=1 Tax=Maribacter polysiphoniae TaxID=429344 RepID=UPI002355E54B|nr:hypothetical protein [Maribacter polysiphoniae]
MKNAMKLSKYLLMSLLTVFIVSCNGEDGEDGLDGINGTQGPAGTNGEDGADGANGQDGNANVVAYTFNLSAESGSSISTDIPALTQDAIDNDLIIGYLQNSQSGTYYPIPAGVWPNGTGGFYDIAVDVALGKYWLHFYQVGEQTFNPISNVELGTLKVVIAESSSTIAGKSNKENIHTKLKSAGVDINDYYAVMDYFGMEY